MDSVIYWAVISGTIVDSPEPELEDEGLVPKRTVEQYRLGNVDEYVSSLSFFTDPFYLCRISTLIEKKIQLPTKTVPLIVAPDVNINKDVPTTFSTIFWFILVDGGSLPRQLTCSQ